jgi:hypothetical protein
LCVGYFLELDFYFDAAVACGYFVARKTMLAFKKIFRFPIRNILWKYPLLTNLHQESPASFTQNRLPKIRIPIPANSETLKSKSSTEQTFVP